MSTNNFLPETYIIPDELEEKDLKLREYLNKIATATNSKDSGFYDDEEIVTGQKFIPVFISDGSSNAEHRDVFRKAIDFGALPNNSTKSVAHEISTTNKLSIVKLYGAATKTNSTNFQEAIPIPYVNSSVPAQGISLKMDNTNVIIETKGGNFNLFNRCFVVIEYLKVI